MRTLILAVSLLGGLGLPGEVLAAEPDKRPFLDDKESQQAIDEILKRDYKDFLNIDSASAPATDEVEFLVKNGWLKLPRDKEALARWEKEHSRWFRDENGQVKGALMHVQNPSDGRWYTYWPEIRINGQVVQQRQILATDHFGSEPPNAQSGYSAHYIGTAARGASGELELRWTKLDEPRRFGVSDPLQGRRLPDDDVLGADGVRIGSRGRNPARSFIDPGTIRDLSIANERSRDLTREQVDGLPKRTAYWQGGDLYYKGDDGRSRKVGYQARMDPVEGAEYGGAVIFWHGGAEPDKEGRHKDGKEAWALFFLPDKPAGAFEVAGGNNTARNLDYYRNFRLDGAQEMRDADGNRRVALWTALRSREVPVDSDSGASMQKRPVFQFGKGDKGLYFYMDMAGNLYQDQKLLHTDGTSETRIVKMGRILFPGTGGNQPDKPVAPSRETDAPPKPGAPAAESARIRALVAKVQGSKDLSLAVPGKSAKVLDALLGYLQSAAPKDPDLARDVVLTLAKSYAANRGKAPGSAKVDEMGRRVREALSAMQRDPGRFPPAVLQAVEEGLCWMAES